MKTLSLLLFTFIFLGTTSAYTNFDSKPPIKWGKVTEFELNLKNYDKQPDATAVILCDYGFIEITNRAMISRHVRIKILSEEGLNHTSFSIPYVHKNDYDDFTLLKAQVINVDKKGNLKINKLAQFEFSKQILNSEDAVVTFTFNDDVKVGSIIEYQYEIASLNVVSMDDWHFQNELPTLWSEIRFDTPEEFTYLVTYKKGDELTPSEKSEFENRLNWLRATKLKRALRELYASNNILYQTSNRNHVCYILNQRKKKIVHKDMPGYALDKPINISKEKSPRLSFHLFQAHGLKHPLFKPVVLAMDEDFENMSKHRMWNEMYPSGYIHYRLPNWNDFNTNYLNHKKFGMQLIRHVDYISLLNDIVSQESSNEEKAMAIYSKLKSTIKWDGEYSTYTSTDLDKVLKNQEGNGADLNLLLTYLLKRSGLNAYPVLVKSKYDGALETSYPAFQQFTHVIVAVQEVSGKVMLFDLTAPINEKSVFEIYQKGWAVKKTDFGWLDFSKAKTYTINKSLAILY